VRGHGATCSGDGRYSSEKMAQKKKHCSRRVCPGVSAPTNRATAIVKTIPSHRNAEQEPCICSSLSNDVALRTAFGPKRDEVIGEWRKLHNEELNDLYHLPNIVRLVK
jgi:hypothetical protein